MSEISERGDVLVGVCMVFCKLGLVNVVTFS